MDHFNNFISCAMTNNVLINLGKFYHNCQKAISDEQAAGAMLAYMHRLTVNEKEYTWPLNVIEIASHHLGAGNAAVLQMENFKDAGIAGVFVEKFSSLIMLEKEKHATLMAVLKDELELESKSQWWEPVQAAYEHNGYMPTLREKIREGRGRITAQEHFILLQKKELNEILAGLFDVRLVAK